MQDNQLLVLFQYRFFKHLLQHINIAHHYNNLPFGLAIGSVFKEFDINEVSDATFLKRFCQLLIICPLNNKN